MRRGFTILELSCVIAIIAFICAASIPVYEVLVYRAQADEARTVLRAIAHAELRHYRDRGTFLACDPGGEVPRPTGAFPAEAPCWRALGFQLVGEVRYRYAVALDGDSFVATAEGDLDRDGSTSRFSLHGRDMQIFVEDELE
ncbi:MAG: prepilin-type N-terminal cleavage/methylation domain-containing protein [Pseudomonadota bacterium]